MPKKIEVRKQLRVSEDTYKILRNLKHKYDYNSFDELFNELFNSLNRKDKVIKDLENRNKDLENIINNLEIKLETNKKLEKDKDEDKNENE